MSYGINIYHPAVKEAAHRGLELDAFEHPPLPPDVVEAFVSRLGRYGYKQMSQSSFVSEFTKSMKGQTVQVSVFANEITFSVPFGPAFESGVFEALQTATELCDTGALVVHDPQAGEWVVG